MSDMPRFVDNISNFKDSRKTETEEIKPKEYEKKELPVMPKPLEVWTKERIEKEFPDLPKVRGPNVLLRIFEEDEDLIRKEDGTLSIIYKPKKETNGVYSQCVGLVVGMGSDCYADCDEKWCDYGQFHMIDKYDAKCYMYDGVPYAEIIDIKVHAQIKDPVKCRKL